MYAEKCTLFCLVNIKNIFNLLCVLSWNISTTKQATSIKLAATVGHFLHDLDFENVHMAWLSCFLFNFMVGFGCLLQTFTCWNGRIASETVMKFYVRNQRIWKVNIEQYTMANLKRHKFIVGGWWFDSRDGYLIVTLILWLDFRTGFRALKIKYLNWMFLYLFCFVKMGWLNW